MTSEWASAAPRLRVNVLGPIEVEVDGLPVSIPVGNQRRLLAALMLARGRFVGHSALAEEIWGDEAPADVKGSIQTTVARLRRSLGAAADKVSLGPAGYALGGFSVERDDEHAERLFRAAEVAPASERVQLIERALGLWRGRAWEEYRDTFAFGPAQAADELWLRLLELQAQTLLEMGRPGDAVGVATDVLHEDPLREDAVATMVRALDGCGRIAEAVEVFDGYRRRLADDLGLDPSPDLRREHERLLRREASPVAGGSLTAAPARPDAARPPPLALLGREALLAEVIERLAEARVLTLVGTGGVGKTSLARAVAAGWHASVWVDLEAIPDGAEVAGAVLRALGVSDAIGVDSLDTAVHHLSSLVGLLVLDNCEHVSRDVATLVSAMRPAAGLTVLTTSRSRLQVPNESVIRVPPLEIGAATLHADATDETRPIGPAETLFLARTGTPSIASSPKAMRSVSTICRVLDGLPLAIEMAAARVGSVSLDDLADRVGTNLELLAESLRGPRRHRTLSETLHWSYHLLDPLHRQIFAGLSCFAADFDLEAAESVLGDLGIGTKQIAGALADLATCCLLEPPDLLGRGWYRMLRPVRCYADERLVGEDRNAVLAAHGRWAAAFAREAATGVQGPREVAWAERIEQRLPDLAAVVDRGGAHAEDIAVALFRWAYLSLSGDVARWPERLLGRGAAPSVGLLTGAAHTAWLRGDMSSARDRALAAIAHGDEPGRSIELAHDILGDVGLVTGDLDESIGHYRVSATGACDAGRLADHANALVGESLAHTFAGRDGLATAQEALTLATRCANPSAEAMARYALGEALAGHDPAAARAQFDVARHRLTGPRRGLSAAVSGTASAALLARHDADRAGACRECADSIAAWLDQGDDHFLMTALRNAVRLLVLHGNPGLARRVLGATSQGPNAAYGALATELAAVAHALGPEDVTDTPAPPDPERWAAQLKELGADVVHALRADARPG